MRLSLLIVSLLALLLVWVAPSCRAPSPDDTARMWTLTVSGLGPIPLCAPLNSVASTFDSVRDTTIESEGEAWPAKAARIAGGEVVFESSWSQQERVWRITVMSVAVATPKGYRVGMPLHVVAQAGEPLLLETPEGRLLVSMQSEGVGATIDSASEAAFFSRHVAGTVPNISDVPSNARIRTLVAGASCP